MTSPLVATADELDQLLRDTAFTRAYGFYLKQIEDGRCTIGVPFQATFERPGGMVSGQVFMAAADVAMWLAILGKLGPRDLSTTSEMTTAFLSRAEQEDFECTAEILKMGRRLIYGVAECVNARGRRLTHHTVSYMRSAVS